MKYYCLNNDNSTYQGFVFQVTKQRFAFSFFPELL